MSPAIYQATLCLPLCGLMLFFLKSLKIKFLTYYGKIRMEIFRVEIEREDFQ